MVVKFIVLLLIIVIIVVVILAPIVGTAGGGISFMISQRRTIVASYIKHHVVGVNHLRSRRCDSCCHRVGVDCRFGSRRSYRSKSLLRCMIDDRPKLFFIFIVVHFGIIVVGSNTISTRFIFGHGQSNNGWVIHHIYHCIIDSVEHFRWCVIHQRTFVGCFNNWRNGCFRWRDIINSR